MSIYANAMFQAEAREIADFVVNQITLGEVNTAGDYNPNRRYLNLTCPRGMDLFNRMNDTFTIGRTEKGRVRIVHTQPGQAHKLFMILTSKGGSCEDGTGRIMVPDKDYNDFKVLARASGSDSETEGMKWETLVIQAPANGIVRVKPSGSCEDYPNKLYLIHDMQVYPCYLEELEALCAKLGCEVPFNLHPRRTSIGFGGDWIIL